METRFGMHFRLKESYSSTAKEAQLLNIKTVQFFATFLKKKQRLTDKDLMEFLEIRKFFGTVYIHNSFNINLGTSNEENGAFAELLFKKELTIAKKLTANYLVLHPGFSKVKAGNRRVCKNSDDLKIKGLRILIKRLNKIFETEDTVKLLLENTTHADKTIGSNLEDFKLMRKLIADKSKISFCLDLSHAFSYGYDINDTETFIDLIDRTMGIENIKLIHLNDTHSKAGSRIDTHAPPGHGKIGKEVLQNIINHPKLRHIDLITELSAADDEKAKEILNEISSW